MSQFIDKAKIAELNCEIESLRHELQNQSKELEDLKEKKAEDITELEWEVSDYRQHDEVDYNLRVKEITKELEKGNNRDNSLEQYLATLELDDAASVAATIDQFYKKKYRPQLIIFFLLGLLTPLAIWVVTDFSQADQTFRALFEHFSGAITRLING